MKKEFLKDDIFDPKKRLGKKERYSRNFPYRSREKLVINEKDKGVTKLLVDKLIEISLEINAETLNLPEAGMKIRENIQKLPDDISKEVLLLEYMEKGIRPQINFKLLGYYLTPLKTLTTHVKDIETLGDLKSFDYGNLPSLEIRGLGPKRISVLKTIFARNQKQ